VTKTYRNNFFAGILIAILLLGFGYYHEDNIGSVFRNLLNRFQPCQRPITYSIERIDSQFGITKDELLGEIKRAEKIWEFPINKPLFEYSPTGDLKISLVYDYRQKATDELRKLGIVISDDRVSYDTVKAKYDSLVVLYEKEKARLAILVDTYNRDKDSFEKDVKYWNSRGGALKNEYDNLQQRRNDLNNQVTIINQAQDSLNNLGDAINSTAIILNKLIVELNLQVNTNNTVGASTGKEFNEGEYVSSAGSVSINIYQFDNQNRLLRVLAHELGHALGLGHLDNPKAIMYYLNEGINEKLTSDDLGALKSKCGID